MKRKFIILIILLSNFSSTTLFAQKWKIGATLSPVLSKYIYAEHIIEQYPELYSKYGLGISAGINFYRLYGKNFMIKTGLLINNKNFRLNVFLSDNNYIETKRSMYFIAFPLAFQYKFKIKKQTFFLNSGFELSFAFATIDKTDKERFTNHYWNAAYEIYFGLGYQFKLDEKHTFYISPEYSPKIFDDDYSTFRLNLGLIF